MTTDEPNDISLDERARAAIAAAVDDRQYSATRDAQGIDRTLANVRTVLEQTRNEDDTVADGTLADAAADIDSVRGWIRTHHSEEITADAIDAELRAGPRPGES